MIAWLTVYRGNLYDHFYVGSVVAYEDLADGVMSLRDTTGTYKVTDLATQLQDSPFHRRVSTASGSIDVSDKGGQVYMNVETANNFTVVDNSIKALPLETEFTVINWGAGQTTNVAGAGVSINSADAALALRVQYSTATL